jgi:DNA-binding MarR family transcriptional regulator
VIERGMAGWVAARPDLDVAPIAVIARILRLSVELQARLDAPLARYGLRSADVAVLATLARLEDSPVTQSRLGRELGLTAGRISSRINRLEREGFVTREQGREDRRQALVAITRPGLEAFDASVGEHLRNSRDLLAGLETEESELLGTLLGKLLGSLDDPGAERCARRARLDCTPSPASSSATSTCADVSRDVP